MSKKILWRFVIWLVVMLYMALDLVVFKGPLHQHLKHSKVDPRMEKLDVAARVFNRPILLSQIDFYVDQKLWSTGRTREGVSDAERLYLRQVSVCHLVDFYIFKEKVKFNSKEFPVTDEEIDAAVARFSSRFGGRDEMLEAIRKFGFQGEKELRYRLAARLQQDKYLDAKLGPGITITDAMARHWYDEYKDKARLPERAKVQHIFCAKLENSEQQALEKLRSAQQQLIAKTQTFAQLASSISEDERSKNSAGELGWIHKGRGMDEFASKVLAAPLQVPTIITTKLGWHLVLVSEKKPAELRSFESMKDEIKLAMASFYRKKAVLEYRISLRKQHADVIRINWKMLEQPWTQNGEKP